MLETTDNDAKSRPEARRDGILKLVREKDVVHVDELMHVFGASRATITRDLAVLQDMGLITKTYGAVISVQTALPRTQVYSYGISLRENIDEKRAIARRAFPLVFNNASVVFNSGVTTFEVAKLIADTKIPVNIVTDSMEIAGLFIHDILRNVIRLGGDLAQGLYMVTGKLICANMEGLQGDMAFLGVHDIDLDEGITMPYSSEAELISVMMKRCRKKIVLADHSKFGRVSLYRVDCSFGDIDMIITDCGIDGKFAAEFRKRGIEVVVISSDLPEALMTRLGVNPALAVLAGLAVGAFSGFFISIIVTHLKINSFIATIGMLSILRGFTCLISKGSNIFIRPKAILFLGQGYLDTVPFPVIVMIFFIIVGTVFLRYTVLGRQICAIGGNERAARLAGVQVNKVRLFVFMTTSTLSAFAGLISSGFLGSAEMTAGTGLELDVIAAVIIGGASLSGGKGTIVGSLAGMRHEAQIIPIGVVIILAVVMDSLRSAKTR